MENENITETLSRILDDPEGMERLKSMAQSLLGSGEPKETDSKENQKENLSSGEMQLLMKAASLLKSDRENDRSRLLMALKPHLSEERRQRVDRAVKLLKIADIMPILGEMDLFK